MAINLARFAHHGKEGWGVVRGERISPLAGSYKSTAALIAEGEADFRAAAQQPGSIEIGDVTLLSPATAPCRVYCQGANYRQHMIESGMNPDEKAFNMFFTKSDASIASAVETVTRPGHVRLLDYEIELGLVFRRPITGATRVTKENLKDFVFGVTIANDLSARDVQLPQTQFFKGKSYRGFCPLGPWLTVLDDDEFDNLDRLQLLLTVNGETRQKDTTANLVFKPAETISELSTFANVMPGDLLLTGTPSGCALRVPPPIVRKTLQLLPDRKFWELFGKAQARRPHYLQPGDRISARIYSDDGRIDLGEQTTRISG